MLLRHGRSLIGCILVLGAAATAAADDFAIPWSTIDAGGGTFSTGGDFELGGSIGQPDASLTIMAGGDFELAGGFWHGALNAGPPCPGDLNGDGDINLADLATLLAHYGLTDDVTYEDGDIDEDGDVDLADLATILAVYGTSCSPRPGDLDGDGDVDLSDLATLLADYGCTGATCEGDIDGDGDTDLSDLATLLANYGT